MKVTLLINERQKNLILLESSDETKILGVIKDGYNLVSDVLTKTSEQIGVNLKFLITWGATIGGLVGPVNDFIRDKHHNLTDIEISLLLTGIIVTYFTDNKTTIKKVYDKINEEGLSKVFKQCLKKSEELKQTFIDFISGLNLTVHNISNILSYTFILPIIPMIYEMVKTGQIDPSNSQELTKRLLSFGLITLSSITVKQLIDKIITRFSK